MSDQEKDPVVHSSLSRPLFIWSALLVLALIWGLYDEMYGIRPWKGYQAKFEKLYSKYLDSAKLGEAEVERQIKASPDYRRLDQQMLAAEKAAMPEASAIDKQVNQDLVPKILALNDPFQEVRSHIGSLTYEIEVSHSDSRKASLRKQIEELKAEVHKVALPGESEKRSMKFDEMDQQLQAWKAQKAELLQKRVEVMKTATELRAQRDKYLSDRISDASSDTILAVQNSLEKFDIRIRQIHIKDVDLVDRCESCHLGTREPVVLTAAEMGGNSVFTSHPDKELLKIHDPEKFGCTPCHGGNGVAVSSVDQGARLQRALAVAAASQGEYRGRVPAVPRPRDRHREGGHAERGPRDFPAAGLHGLPSLRRVRSRGGRDVVGQPADPPARRSRRRSGCGKPASRYRRATRRAATPKRSTFTRRPTTSRCGRAGSTRRWSSSICGRAAWCAR